MLSRQVGCRFAELVVGRASVASRDRGRRRRLRHRDGETPPMLAPYSVADVVVAVAAAAATRGFAVDDVLPPLYRQISSVSRRRRWLREEPAVDTLTQFFILFEAIVNHMDRTEEKHG